MYSRALSVLGSKLGRRLQMDWPFPSPGSSAAVDMAAAPMGLPKPSELAELSVVHHRLTELRYQCDSPRERDHTSRNPVPETTTHQKIGRSHSKTSCHQSYGCPMKRPPHRSFPTPDDWPWAKCSSKHRIESAEVPSGWSNERMVMHMSSGSQIHTYTCIGLRLIFKSHASRHLQHRGLLVRSGAIGGVGWWIIW